MTSSRGHPGFVDHPAKFLDAQRAGLFRGHCVGVVDGDTFDVVLDLGFRQYALVTVRLLGVDTPELNAREELERSAAREVRERVSELVLSRQVLVRSYKDRQTFGRYVAEVWLPGPVASPPEAGRGPDVEGQEVLRIGDGEDAVDWRSLAGILLAEGLAVAADR